MELIYCAAKNIQYAEIAQRYGFSYGAQLPNRVYFPPVFCDQEWKLPDDVKTPTQKVLHWRKTRQRYMAALREHKPRLATVLDWEYEWQFGEVMGWAHEAALYVSEAVIIIPKVRGSVHRIPHSILGKEVRLGYSVPTRHGGTTVHPSEFAGYPVHLLGGSPNEQIRLSKLPFLNVVSADTNYHQKQAKGNRFYCSAYAGAKAKNKHFMALGDSVYGDVIRDAPYLAFELSCMNILSAWAGCIALIRFAVEADLPAVKSIANQYRDELGYVMMPALRESMARRNLLVAELNNQIIGFVNYRACRDGWQTIYEIAVHRDWTGGKVGSGLLAAVPRPIRLKCVLSNMKANQFYSKQGFDPVGIEQGKKRRLLRWELPVAKA